MSMVFRKSVLGFNKDDVLKYINELFSKMKENEAKSKEAEEALNQKLTESKATLDSANKNIESLIGETERLQRTIDKLNGILEKEKENNKKITEELNIYRSKEQEINDLGEIIGKLFLVSKLNAETIIKSANDSKNATVAEIEENLEKLENAQSKFEEMKEIADNSTTSFKDQLDELIYSLATTKGTLIGNTDKTADAEKSNYDLLNAAKIEIE